MKQILLTIFATLTLANCAPVQSSKGLVQGEGIVGGEVVPASEAIAQSTVQIIVQLKKADNTTYTNVCGASIVSSSTLITAAHCFDAKPGQPAVSKKVFINFSISSAVKSAPSGKWASTFVTHPKYVLGGIGTYDLAIVKFENGLPGNYSPIQMETDPSSLDSLTSVVAAGYGLYKESPDDFSSSLKKVTLQVTGEASNWVIKLTQSNTAGACSGDSGGPIYSADEDGPKLVGILITAAGQDGKHCNVYSQAIRMDFASSFIEENL